LCFSRCISISDLVSRRKSSWGWINKEVVEEEEVDEDVKEDKESPLPTQGVEEMAGDLPDGTSDPTMATKKIRKAHPRAEPLPIFFLNTFRTMGHLCFWTVFFICF
jgi:hypothetical protein